MPKPKKNTDYKIGDEGNFPSIITEYLKKNRLPESWGSELERWQNAEFLAKLAAKWDYFETLEQGNTNYDRQNYPFRMMDLFALAPDEFLAFMTFVRKSLRVRGMSHTAQGFLREGAVQRFKNDNGHEPTDDELAQML